MRALGFTWRLNIEETFRISCRLVAIMKPLSTCATQKQVMDRVICLDWKMCQISATSWVCMVYFTAQSILCLYKIIRRPFWETVTCIKKPTCYIIMFKLFHHAQYVIRNYAAFSEELEGTRNNFSQHRGSGGEKLWLCEKEESMPVGGTYYIQLDLTFIIKTLLSLMAHQSLSRLHLVGYIFYGHGYLSLCVHSMETSLSIKF